MTRLRHQGLSRRDPANRERASYNSFGPLLLKLRVRLPSIEETAANGSGSRGHCENPSQWMDAYCKQRADGHSDQRYLSEGKK
jgi:hypothetical protein